MYKDSTGNYHKPCLMEDSGFSDSLNDLKFKPTINKVTVKQVLQISFSSITILLVPTLHNLGHETIPLFLWKVWLFTRKHKGRSAFNK